MNTLARRSLAATLLLTLLALFACGQPGQPEHAAEQREPIDHMAVLVFSATSAQRHEVIPFTNEQFQALDDRLAERANADRVTIDVIDDAQQFPDTLDDLQQYHAIVFNNNSGDILNDAQRDAFQQYIRNGGGYVGIHATIGAHRTWDWYTDLIGARFASTPYLREMTINIEDRTHPATAHLPAQWEVFDEPYDFNVNPRGNVHVLATYEPTSFDGSRMTDGHLDHPVTWAHHFDGGRAFYTALGQTRESFGSDAFLDKILGAILWAGGIVEHDTAATIWASYDISDSAQHAPNIGHEHHPDAPDLTSFPHFDSQPETARHIQLPDPDDRHEHALPDYFHNKWIVVHTDHHTLYVVSVDDDNQPYEVSPFLPDVQLSSPASLSLSADSRLSYVDTASDDPVLHNIDYHPTDR